MSITIGQILKQRRHERQATQAQICAGICSQSMLSAIEHDQYIPNAQLLIALSQRLALTLDTFSLATNYAVSGQPDFNAQTIALCNQHRYQELLALLLRADVIAPISTSAQTQSYYYYLAVAQLQAGPQPDLAKVQGSLRLSLASATTAQPALTRLAQVTSACLTAKSGQTEGVVAQVETALAGIAHAPFDENLNIVFYLAALTNYYLDKPRVELKQLTQGIDFITAHDSHYLLANCYYLRALLTESAGPAAEGKQAHDQATFLADLFHEKVYKF